MPTKMSISKKLTPLPKPDKKPPISHRQKPLATRKTKEFIDETNSASSSLCSTPLPPVGRRSSSSFTKFNKVPDIGSRSVSQASSCVSEECLNSQRDSLVTPKCTEELSLAFRMPDGARIVASFNVSSSMKTVLSSLMKQWKNPSNVKLEELEVLHPVHSLNEKNAINGEEMRLALCDLHIHDKSLLIIQIK